MRIIIEIENGEVTGTTVSPTVRSVEKSPDDIAGASDHPIPPALARAAAALGAASAGPGPAGEGAMRALTIPPAVREALRARPSDADAGAAPSAEAALPIDSLSVPLAEAPGARGRRRRSSRSGKPGASKR